MLKNVKIALGLVAAGGLVAVFVTRRNSGGTLHGHDVLRLTVDGVTKTVPEWSAEETQ
jgi:hypothetical protein